MIEEQDEYNRIRRLHPQAEKCCCARSAMTWKTVFNRHPPTVRMAAATTGSSSSASGTTLCPTPRNLPRKKVSLPWTSTLNWSASRATTSPRSPVARSGQPCPQCARTARRFSGRPACGTASNNPFARRSLLSQATPCVSTTATAATRSLVSVGRGAGDGETLYETARSWPTPQRASPPRLP